jgi:site-specific recombinase XerD
MKTLIEVFEYHNEKLADLVGKDFAPATHKRYITTLSHIKDYLKYQYKTDNILLSELKYEFISNLEYYFKKVRNCNNNSTVKYIRNLKKVINLAIKNEWLDKDPFAKYTSHINEVKREFLSLEELKALEEKEISMTRLGIIRDIFVFACYTGLAYVDIANLSKDNLVIGIDGEKWIYTYRNKTDTKSNIPLMPKAVQIVEKYKDHPLADNKGKLFPVPSNQKVNAYLKEISELCGINKCLTFHLARHTFATTVTLTNGVPIETVSSMLGHKSLRTTQIYAKVVERKVSDDMKVLKEKLKSNSKSHDSKYYKKSGL